MTTAETIVLDNLSGPDSRGINDAVFTSKCWHDELPESKSWPILKDLVDRGLVARFSEHRGDGERLYYKLTPAGVTARDGAVLA